MATTVRSGLCAGLAVGVLAAAAVVPITAPAATALPMVSLPAVDLAAALQPLLDPAVGTGTPAPAAATANVGGETASPGDVIINIYNVVQPWVAYGVELFAWAVEWLPWPIGLLAPQADIIYSGWQPFAQGVVYSLAFLVDGQFDLVVPTLVNGIQTGVSTLIANEISWILSFFPPLPPFPPIGIGAATPAAATAATRGTPAADTTQADTTQADTTQADTTQAGAVAETPDPARAESPARARADRTAGPHRRATPAPAATASVTGAEPTGAEQTGQALRTEQGPESSPRAVARTDRADRADGNGSGSAARARR